MTRLLSLIVSMGLVNVGCQSSASPPPQGPRTRARMAPRANTDSRGLNQARQQYARVHTALAKAVKRGGTPLVKKLLAGLPVKVPLECAGLLHSSLGLHRVPVHKKGLVGTGLQPGLLVVVGPGPEHGENVKDIASSPQDASLCAFMVGRKSKQSPYGLLVSALTWTQPKLKGSTMTTHWKQFPRGNALLMVEVEQKPTKGRAVGDENGDAFAKIRSEGTLYSYIGGRFHNLRSHNIETVNPVQGDGDNGYERSTVTHKFFSLGSPPKHIAVSIERHETHKPPLPGTPAKDVGVVDRWNEMYMLYVFSQKLDALNPASDKQSKTLLAFPALAPYRKEKSGTK